MTVSDGRTDVLIVAAAAPDLVGLRPHLGDKLAGAVRGLTVRTKVVGFGPGISGATTARGLLAITPRAVVLVGTCGVYPGRGQYQPHDVLVATKVIALDHAVVQGGAEWPTPMSTELQASPAMVTGLVTGRHRTFAAPVTSPLALTRSDALAASAAAATSAHAECVDALGVASAAVGAEIPFACVLGVANLVGSTGRADWHQFHREAVTQAANAVVAWLHAGAPGLPFGGAP
jgi:nucleoside phosphorylase